MSSPKLAGYLTVVAVVATMLALVPETLAQARRRDRDGVRKYFRCPPCDDSNCPATSHLACELVLETGVCGCCKVCARLEGQFCGLTVGRCGQDMACRPTHNDPDPIGAILDGRAVCRRLL